MHSCNRTCHRIITPPERDEDGPERSKVVYVVEMSLLSSNSSGVPRQPDISLRTLKGPRHRETPLPLLPCLVLVGPQVRLLISSSLLLLLIPNLAMSLTSISIILSLVTKVSIALLASDWTEIRVVCV